MTTPCYRLRCPWHAQRHSPTDFTLFYFHICLAFIRRKRNTHTHKIKVFPKEARRETTYIFNHHILMVDLWVKTRLDDSVNETHTYIRNMYTHFNQWNFNSVYCFLSCLLCADKSKRTLLFATTLWDCGSSSNSKHHRAQSMSRVNHLLYVCVWCA